MSQGYTQPFPVPILTSGTAITVTYGSGTASVAANVASQSDMETATSNTVLVTPGVAQYHPSAAKAWLNMTGTGVIAINASYNVSGITDLNTGYYTITFDVDFSSVNYVVQVTCSRNAAYYTQGLQMDIVSFAVGSCNISAGIAGATDPSKLTAVFFGDQ